MFLDDSVTTCVVFIYVKAKDRSWRAVGTAVSVGDPILGTDRAWQMLVTARHVIEKAAQYTTEKNTLYLRVNTSQGGVYVPMLIDGGWIGHPSDPIKIAEDPSEWLERSDQLRFDIAIGYMPELPYEHSVKAWSRNDFVEDLQISTRDVSAGGDIAMTGLYRAHLGRDRNVPIIRSGIIAALPDDPVMSALGPMEAYLIETRSLGGLSGSPVFWLSGTDRLVRGSHMYVQREWVTTKLLGIVSGHFDNVNVYADEERMNQGVAYIVPARIIRETLSQEEVVGPRKQAEEKFRNREAAAVLDSIDDDTQSGHERVSLAGLDPEAALRALLKTRPHGQTQDPA